MKAIVQDAYGSPDVLRLAEIGRGVIVDDEAPGAIRYRRDRRAHGKVVITLNRDQPAGQRRLDVVQVGEVTSAPRPP